jgi:hypothetical protein
MLKRSRNSIGIPHGKDDGMPTVIDERVGMTE